MFVETFQLKSSRVTSLSSIPEASSARSAMHIPSQLIQQASSAVIAVITTDNCSNRRQHRDVMINFDDHRRAGVGPTGPDKWSTAAKPRDLEKMFATNFNCNQEGPSTPTQLANSTPQWPSNPAAPASCEAATPSALFSPVCEPMPPKQPPNPSRSSPRQRVSNRDGARRPPR